MHYIIYRGSIRYEISARIRLSSGKLGLLFVGEHKVLNVFF